MQITSSIKRGREYIKCMWITSSIWKKMFIRHEEKKTEWEMYMTSPPKRNKRSDSQDKVLSKKSYSQGNKRL